MVSKNNMMCSWLKMLMMHFSLGSKKWITCLVTCNSTVIAGFIFWISIVAVVAPEDGKSIAIAEFSLLM